MINEYTEEEMKNFLLGDSSCESVWLQDDMENVKVFNPVLTRSKGFSERFYEEVEREELSFLTLHYTPYEE